MYGSSFIPVAAIALLCAASSAPAQDVTMSDAEKHLFIADHLSDLPPKATLHYDFAKSGTLEKGFRDDVTMSVGKSEGKAAGRHVAVKFLNGDHRVELPELDDAKGNPIIMYFL